MTQDDKLPISSSDYESFSLAIRDYLNQVRDDETDSILKINEINSPLNSLGADIQNTIEKLQTRNNELMNKSVWYESILDSIPFPVSVTDLNMNWTFLNRAVEKLAGIPRTEGIGKPCSTWNTHICQTDKCTMQLFQKEVNNTLYEQDGRVYRIECAYVSDKNGNKSGMMETLIDVTAMQKTLQYLEQSVSIISEDLGKIAEGNTNFSSRVLDGDADIKDVREKFVVISNSVESVRIAIENLVYDSHKLSKSAIDGILDTRADASKHKGDFQKVIKGVNDTLDAVISPLNVAAEYVDRISKGDIPPRITDSYNGDFNEIKNNLNTCIDCLNKLIFDTHSIYEKQKAGDIDANIDTTGYQGVYKTIIEGYNDAINLHIKNILTILTILTSYAEGNFTPVLQKLPGKQELANEKMDLLRGNLLALIEDTNTLTNAATEGDLSTRADAMKHQGDFKKIITGINATLDAVINPLNMAAEYVDRISKGEIPSLITDTYNGDFNKIKNNLNQCINGLGGLVECNDIIQRLVVNDHTRKVENQSPGIFGSMGKATNQVRERLLSATALTNDIAIGNTSRLSELKKIGKRSEQDLLMPAFIHCMENVQRLIEETNMLSQAAVEGRLATRANAANHEGDFKKIIEGINLTLDSVTIPVNEALRVSKEYSHYQFRTRIDPTINLSGDWMEFKNALDNIGIQVSSAVGLINSQFLDLASNAEEATASIEEVSAGAQQIAHSSVGVSKNAEQGNEGINQVVKAMEDLTVTVGEVSQRAEQVSSSAVQANEFSKIGINLAKKSEASMMEMTRSSSEVDQIINEINIQMADIGKIIRLISDIASQTNLLALNAAIEAARAGEAGRGFAVVAAEVKSLAQDSRKSAENIADMISTLQDKAQKATTAMAYADKTVTEGSKSLTETLDAFNKIASSIDDITRNAMDVAAASEEQAASVEEVTASIHEVSTLLINTANEAGNTAAATEEVSGSIEQISKVVSNVSGIADSVSREMSKFVV